MKTYTVYDYHGNKRTIKAANIAHARRIAARNWGCQCNVCRADS